MNRLTGQQQLLAIAAVCVTTGVGFYLMSTTSVDDHHTQAEISGQTQIEKSTITNEADVEKARIEAEREKMIQDQKTERLDKALDALPWRKK
jgi:hypothetical protein